MPISAARYQASRNYPWKWEWTSVLGSRAFLDVIGGNWYNFFPLDPTDHHGFASNVEPGRIDTTTNQRTGYHDAYQDQKRYKPQVYATCRTSRMAGLAATTSSSGTTGSAIAVSSVARSRSTSTTVT